MKSICVCAAGLFLLSLGIDSAEAARAKKTKQIPTESTDIDASDCTSDLAQVTTASDRWWMGNPASRSSTPPTSSSSTATSDTEAYEGEYTNTDFGPDPNTPW